jgi:tetratricopeptide (TPR) repeat protein
MQRLTRGQCESPALRVALAVLVAAVFIAGCQPSPEKLRAEAERALATDDYAEASIHLKNLLLRTPNDAWARAALGATALRLGDPDSAEKELRRAMSLGAPPENRVTLVQALLANGNFAAALKEIEGISTASPAEVLMLTGLAHRGLAEERSASPAEARKDFDEAEKNFRQAAVAAPGETGPRTALAELMLMQQRVGEADALIAEALAIDPDAVDAVLIKGQRELEVHGPKEAAAYLASALTRSKSSAARAGLLNLLAEIQLDMTDVKAAAESARQLEALAPGQLQTRFLRARVLAASGDYERAIRMLQRVLSDTERILGATTGEGRDDVQRLNLAVERALGEAQFLNNNFEQAATHISRVIAVQGSDPALELRLLQIRRQQSDVRPSLQPMIRKGPGAGFDEGLVTFGNESALEYYRRRGGKDTDNLSTRLGEISARLASGDTATARTLLDGLRASQDGDQLQKQIVDYLSVMVDVQHDNAKAQAAARALVSEHPREAWSHLLLATAYGYGGLDDDARREFEAVLEVNPANREAELNLAQLDYKGGDPKSGERRLLRMIESNPQDLRPQVQLVEAQLAAGRFEEALDRARQAAKIAPDDVQSLSLLGRAAAASGKWEEALVSLQRLSVLFPNNPRVWTNLARATVAASNRTTWPESMDRALAIAPTDPAVLTSAGDLRMDLRQPSDAVKYYGQAYDKAPSWELAVRDCGARSSLDPSADCTLLRSWLERNPRDVGARLFYAEKLLRLGREDAAIAQFESVLGVDPRQATALNTLAWLYFQKRDDRALAMAERALEAQPESAPAKDTLGWIQLRRGDKSGGLKLIREAANVLVKDPETQYHLAFALAENGQGDQARKSLDKTLRLNPRFPSRAEAEQLMQRLGGADQSAGG